MESKSAWLASKLVILQDRGLLGIFESLYDILEKRENVNERVKEAELLEVAAHLATIAERKPGEKLRLGGSTCAGNYTIILVNPRSPYSINRYVSMVLQLVREGMDQIFLLASGSHATGVLTVIAERLETLLPAFNRVHSAATYRTPKDHNGQRGAETVWEALVKVPSYQTT